MKIKIVKHLKQEYSAYAENIKGETLTVKAEPVSMDKDPDGEVFYMMKVIEGEYKDKLTVKVYEKNIIFEEGDTIV